MKNIVFICLTAFFFADCNKDKGDAQNPDAEEYYLEGLLHGSSTPPAGEVLEFEVKSSSNAELVISNDAVINSPDCTYSYGCGIGTGLGTPGEKSVSITFHNLYSGACGAQLATFPTLFVPGKYAIGNGPGQVQITYFDGAESWTSMSQFQWPSNFYFEVTESKVIQSPLGVSMKVSGKLACHLVKSSTWDAEMSLTDVTFALSFWPEQ